ncbi:hypothetical protein J7I80_03465 [Bacillus sp. ISL-41]|uniref:hypothetical protein n=1 Tax=Bacillus sp. ISL-41 TaxID=2819127 RepID=UPI001BEC4989|nr:hypothetical protein [Bacillus sp. ISL-41]MBT2641287.1 hypothetical protein [Bacillus sp. ISL-41]
MINKKGRPQRYSKEELLEILTNYALNNIGKITFLNLEKETGIHRHIWSRRMSEQINELNQSYSSLDAESFEAIPLPNIIDTVNKYWENKKAMINALNEYNTYIQALWEKAVAFEKASQKERELLQLLEEKDKEIRFLKDNRDFYKNEYQKISIESTYDHKQKENNIENVININDKKKMTTSNWKDNFPGLFE